jgi:hypothetical protein
MRRGKPRGRCFLFADALEISCREAGLVDSDGRGAGPVEPLPGIAIDAHIVSRRGVSWQRPSVHNRCRRLRDIVCASPIAQQVGQPRSATTPAGASSRLNRVTGANATDPASSPNPMAPRAK